MDVDQKRELVMGKRAGWVVKWVGSSVEVGVFIS